MVTIPLSLSLFDKQQEFVDHPADQKYLLGGRQCGKTVATLALAGENALNGEEVLHYSPRHHQSNKALDLFRSSKWMKAGTVARNTKSVVHFQSGGEIKFRSANTDHRGIPINRGKIVVADEISHFPQETIDLILDFAKHGERVYATGTPADPAHPVFTQLKNVGFHGMVAFTVDNPRVDRDFVMRRKGELPPDTAEHMLMTARTIGKHAMHSYDDKDERHVQCISCGLGESLPLDADPETLATAEAFIFGKALSEPCA